MADWLDTLRRKQQRVTELEQELAELKAELRDARAILSGRPNEPELPLLRPRSRHGFTGGKRAKPIQQGSSVWWTVQVLRDTGAPMHIDNIITTIFERSGETVKKATLVSNLSRYIAHNDTFVRPEPSVYGLLDYSRPPE